MCQERDLREDAPMNLMPLETALELFAAFHALGCIVWLDGGWAVDALLGGQTRPHADLDIAIEQENLPRLCACLKLRGYADVERQDTRPWNFVLGDAEGHDVDIHVIVLDPAGNGIYGPAECGEMYPVAALSGSGVVGHLRMHCISAEYLVRFHTGYPLRPHDRADVAALCRRFGLANPHGPSNQAIADNQGTPQCG